MTKINREEYEVLKELDDKWKWIARDKDRDLYAFTEKPVRKYDFSPNWDTETEVPYSALELIDEIHLFQFIQWEDEEPHNIAELIEEYEYHNEPVKLVGDLSITQAKYDKYLEEHIKELEKESEETEVKNMKWFKKKLDDIEVNTTSLQNHDAIWMLNRVHELYDQLDELEVLSQEWIDENEEQEEMYGTYGVPSRRLQNLLVPKQELPVIPKFVAEWYESEGKRNSWWNWFYKWGRDEGRTELETKTIRWMQEFNEEKFVDIFKRGYTVEKEQKYQVIIRDGEYMRLYLCKYDDNVTIGTNDNYIEKCPEVTYLTEQEIKGYDERYWAFRKPIEGLEE